MARSKKMNGLIKSNSIKAPARGSDKPLYAQLSDNIKLAIQENGLKPGDRLPSEHELIKQFGVSRITVRLATQGLENEGIITRVRGRGSFVAEPKIQHKSKGTQALGSHFYRSGEKVTNHLIEKTLGFAASMYTEALDLPSERQVFKVRRLKKVGDTILGLETRLFPAEMSKRFSDEELNSDAFLEILERSPDTKITRISYWVTSASISEMEADLLRIQPELPVLIQHGTFFNSNDQPVMTGRIVYPADKMEIHYEHNSPDQENGERSLM